MERRANGRTSPHLTKKGSKKNFEDALFHLANSVCKPGIGRRTKEPYGDSSRHEFHDGLEIGGPTGHRDAPQVDGSDISCIRSRDVVDGLQLYKTRPDLVHPIPIPLGRVPPFIHSLVSLPEVSTASNSNTTEVSTSDQGSGVQSTVLADSTASDFEEQSDIKYPTLRFATGSLVCNGDPHSTGYCQSPTLSMAINRAFSPTPIRQAASIMSSESQSSLLTIYTPTPAESLSMREESQSIIASNNYEEKAVLSSGDNGCDDDEMLQEFSSIHRELCCNGHQTHVVPTTLTKLTSRKAGTPMHAPSQAHSPLGALFEMSSGHRSLFPQKHLYGHQFASQSDSGVHRVVLQDVRSSMDRDLDVHSSGVAGRTILADPQEKRTSSQSRFSSLFSSFSTSLMSVRDRSSSKAKLLPIPCTSDLSTIMCLNQTSKPSRESMRKPRNDIPTQETESWYSKLNRVSHPSPMSSKAHSKSMSALSPDISIHGSSNYNVRPSGCTYCNRNVRGPCRFHKELPTLPTGDCDGMRNIINYGGNSKLYPGPSMGSLPSKISSSTQPYGRATSMLDQVMSFASSGLPKEARCCAVHKSNECRSNSVRNQTHSTPHQARTQVVLMTKGRDAPQPSTIIRRAIERHAGAGLQPHVVVNSGRRDIAGAASHPEKGREAQIVSTYDVGEHRLPSPQQYRRAGPRNQVYLSQMSASSPCLQRSPAKEFSKWASSSRVEIQPRRLATGSIVSAQVSAVNVRAEIVAPAVFQPQSGMNTNESDSRRHGEADTTSEFDFRKSTSRSNLVNQTSTKATVSTSFERESIPFFEPFHAGAQTSTYISFHFDISHLETQETERSGARHQTDKREGIYQNDRDFLGKRNLEVVIRDTNSKFRTESAPAASSETILISDVADLAPAVVGPVIAAPGPTEGIHGLYQGLNHRRRRSHIEETQSRCREDMGIFPTQGVAIIDKPACLRMRRPPLPPPLPSAQLGMHGEDRDNEEEVSVSERFRSLQDHLRTQGPINAEYGRQIFSKSVLNLGSTVSLPIGIESSSSPKEIRPSRLKWGWPWWVGYKQRK